MNLVTVTLGDLVDRALLELRAPSEVGFTMSPVSGQLTTAEETIFQVSDITRVNVTDVIEVCDELMYVTELNPPGQEGYIRVERGYYGTTAEGHTGCSLTLNPPWPRHRVAEGVRRAFARLEAFNVPLLVSTIMFPVPSDLDADRLVLELPAETRDVWSVRYGLEELWNWEFLNYMPRSAYRSGKVVRLPRGIPSDTELYVTYRVPYRWSSWPDDPTSDSEIIIMEGAEDLPAQYGAAWAIAAREVSRSELDRTEEYNQTEPLRNGVSLSFVRAKWQEFYRALDEASRLNPPPPRQRLNIRRKRWS